MTQAVSHFFALHRIFQRGLERLQALASAYSFEAEVAVLGGRARE